MKNREKETGKAEETTPGTTMSHNNLYPNEGSDSGRV